MLILNSELKKMINSDAERAYPDECCGFMLGTLEDKGEKRLVSVFSAENSRESTEKYHRFEIKAEDMMAAEKKARSLGLDVLGFYHSHPDHPAKPSDFDRDHALPFYSYVIVSVREGKAGDFTSWELLDDRSGFSEEQMRD